MFMEIINNPVVITALIVVIVLLLLLFGLSRLWRKVPQDRAIVVTGMHKRVITGGGGLVIPLLERTDEISLQNMEIPIQIAGFTSTGVELTVNAVAILKIKNDSEHILAAMEQFNVGNINGTLQKISNTSLVVLGGKLREILSKMTVEEIYQDREKFASLVQEVTATELENMGLEIKSFTVKELTDDQNYLMSLGKKQIAEVKKSAAIAESNAAKEQAITIAENERTTAVEKARLSKETAVMIAQAKQEQEQANIIADTNIANANKEKNLKVLSNEREVQTQKANSDAAYEIEQNKVQQQIIETQMAAKLTQEAKNVDLTNAQMKVELTKKQQETTIAQQEAIRRQEELAATMQKTAEAEATKLKISADAALYKTKQDAEAAKVQAVKKAEAEAEQRRLAAVSEAEAKKVQAEADSLAIERKGFANAKATEAEGLAKAKATEAEGLAEAKVIREKAFAEAEAMQKKAEAYKQYGEAAMTEMVVKALPEITKSMSEAIAEPMSKIGSITIVDSGSSDSKGASKVAGYASDLLTQVPEVVKATTGIDLISILGKVSKNFLETGVQKKEEDKENE